MQNIDAEKFSLQVKNISKSFGGLKVFENISFDLREQEILGVIGPNGAGKTTLINVMCGSLAPSTGSIHLYGKDLTGKPLNRISHLGLLRSFQQTNIFGAQSVRDNMDYARHFNKSALPVSVLESMLDRYGFTGRLNERADSLPYGLQKLLGLLLAYACDPKVLLLDEPAAGLETSERHHIDDFIHQAKSELGCSIIIVEHDIDLIRRLCDRCIVLDGGALIAEGAPNDVLQRPDVLAAYLGDFEEAEHAENT